MDECTAIILDRSLHTHVINIIKVHAYDRGPILMLHPKNMIGNLADIRLHVQINPRTSRFFRLELIEIFIVEYAKNIIWIYLLRYCKARLYYSSCLTFRIMILV